MFLKRLALCVAILAAGLLLGATAQAKKFSLTGGGGQTHIGNGLALPIQVAVTSATTGTVFPPLLVPPVPGATLSGTVAKPLLTAMATSLGPVTKSGYQRKLMVPVGVLSKAAAQITVGVKFSNTALFAVATNGKYVWPAAPAVFSTGAAVGTTVVADSNGTMTYSNALGSRFGGAAQFAVSPGVPSGLIPGSPVTAFLKINGTTPACTHNAFGGTDAGCVAGLLPAYATGVLGMGGPTATTVTTPGGPVAPNVAIVKLGLTPIGTIVAAAPAGTNPLLPTNMATSQPGPWTTGKIIISNPGANAGTEKFTLSGKDSRTADGYGTIQMVSGALSKRIASGPNANRGWVQLELSPIILKGPVPASSPMTLVAAAGLIVLAAGYVVRRYSAA